MKIRSQEELVDRVDQEKAWRKFELVTFKRIVEDASSTIQPVLLRGSVPMLYAHWEGFVKNTSYWYACYLNSKRLAISEVRDEVAAAALRSKINPASQSHRIRDRASLINAIRGRSERIAFRLEHIDTGSNLDSHHLEDILLTIGGDPADFSPYSDLIDEQLLRSRNSIAHGEEDYIRLGEWRELQSCVVELIDRYGDCIFRLAANRTYLAR